MKLTDTIKAYLRREDRSYRDNLDQLNIPARIEEYRAIAYERL